MSHERAVPIETEIEFRSNGNKHSFTGYSALFDVPSEPFAGGVREVIEPGAFRRTLAQPTRKTLVIDHEETRLLGSNTANTVHWSEDSKGLLVEAPELPDTSYVRDARELHDRGETSGMSFEFSKTAKGVTWSQDRRERRLTEVKLFHSTILQGLTPRYAGTTAELRALADTVDADPADIDDLIDAIREQRRLDQASSELLDRLLAAVRPEPIHQPETPAESGLVPVLKRETHRSFLDSRAR